MSKYITIVIRCDDETAARKHVPGTMIGVNMVTAVALGDALTLNDKYRDMIPQNKQKQADAADMENLNGFLPKF